MKKLLVLMSLVLTATACVEEAPQPTPDNDAAQAREEARRQSNTDSGKADDASDECQALGLYGDGLCDPFCKTLDPDCGSDDPCTRGAISADEEGSYYDDGICDDYCPDFDIDCQQEPVKTCSQFEGTVCGADEYCHYNHNDELKVCNRFDNAGVCRPKPSRCIPYSDPVCGCDGATYANACEAASAGANIVSEGACGQPQPPQNPSRAEERCLEDTDCGNGERCAPVCVDANIDGTCVTEDQCIVDELTTQGECELGSDDCGDGLVCLAECVERDLEGNCAHWTHICAEDPQGPQTDHECIDDPDCGDGQCVETCGDVDLAGQCIVTNACVFPGAEVTQGECHPNSDDCGDGLQCLFECVELDLEGVCAQWTHICAEVAP